MIQPSEGTPPSAEALAEIMRNVETFHDELRAAGAWVFAGGLHGPETATVLRPEDEDVLITDGPYAEGKEYLGGLCLIKAPDLDAALEWAGRRPGPPPCPSRCARSCTRRGLMTGAVDVETVFRAEYGRAVSVLVRFLGDIDLAEEAVQDAFATALRDWPRTGVPPNPAGWIITTARNARSTVCAGSPPGTPATPRPRGCSRPTHRPRRGPCATTGSV